jgi:sec-independent protein translocase protein TatB
MFNVGPGELMAILALALIVLGPQRLPEAVRTVGRVVGELRRISSGFQEELRNALDDSEVERDLDRLRGTGDGRDGADQRELPLTDQPELPLGAVQYPSGFEPIDVDPSAKTSGADPEGKDPTIDDDPPPFEPPPPDDVHHPDDLDVARAAAEPGPGPVPATPEAAPSPGPAAAPDAAADVPVVTSEGADGNGEDEGGPEAPVEAEAPGAGPERNGS